MTHSNDPGNLIHLRQATESDAPSLWVIRTEAIRQGCVGHYSADQIAAWSAVPMPAAFIEAITQSVFLAAEWDGVLCGFGFMNPETSEVEGIFVSPSFHRNGIGSRLLARLEDRARTLGLTQLTLNATLNAEPFYASSGYRIVERKPWRHPNGFELPSAAMEKVICGGQ
jgi:GNAT superfamily N-acetyltransferase